MYISHPWHVIGILQQGILGIIYPKKHTRQCCLWHIWEFQIWESHGRPEETHFFRQSMGKSKVAVIHLTTSELCEAGGMTILRQHPVMSYFDRTPFKGVGAGLGVVVDGLYLVGCQWLLREDPPYGCQYAEGRFGWLLASTYRSRLLGAICARQGRVNTTSLYPCRPLP